MNLFVALALAFAVGVAGWWVRDTFPPPALETCHPAVLMLEPDSPEPLFINGLEVCATGLRLHDPLNRKAPGFPPQNGEDTMLEVK